jgi:putative intracellular protease/amidase
VDGLSDPRDDKGYAKEDVLSLGYLSYAPMVELMKSTVKLADVSEKDFDAIVVVGGQSPMFTFPRAEKLHRLLETFYSSGRVTAALCHGTSALLFTKAADGSPLIKGKMMTGFSNTEEQFADDYNGGESRPGLRSNLEL